MSLLKDFKYSLITATLKDESIPMKYRVAFINKIEEATQLSLELEPNEISKKTEQKTQ
jgi:hypothetical protein